MKGRSIHNIRLALNLIDYSYTVQGRGLVMFLEFYKAFYSAEHPFILKTLNYFGFGERFIKIIGILYNGINSSVALEHGTGWCGSSPLLFRQM